MTWHDIVTGVASLGIGDCRELLRQLPDASVDAVVTDPPYHLTSEGDDEQGFMGKTWDGGGVAFDPETWREVLRVLKPGGYLVAFGGTRTYHRMACAVEDAGFWILDSLHWAYGSGFPKNRDVSKDIDKKLGVKREVLGPSPFAASPEAEAASAGRSQSGRTTHPPVTAPATPEAQAWNGWGTALKPAHEPIVLAQKPFDLTFADQVLQHGNGVMNLGACRVGDEVTITIRHGHSGDHGIYGGDGRKMARENPPGRFPPNVLLTHSAECEFVSHVVEDRPMRVVVEGRRKDVGLSGSNHSRVTDPQQVVNRVYRCAPGCPVALMDQQSGPQQSRKGKPRKSAAPGEGYGMVATGAEYDDAGGASRFYPNFEWESDPFLYCPKPSVREREYGCEALPLRSGGEMTDRKDGSDGLKSPRAGAGRGGGRRNSHPTIKPVALMRWLVRLVTPPGGLVLDPFAGSGTTGIAALREGFRFVGCELEQPHAVIAAHRIQKAYADLSADPLRPAK